MLFLFCFYIYKKAKDEKSIYVGELAPMRRRAEGTEAPPLQRKSEKKAGGVAVREQKGERRDGKQGPKSGREAKDDKEKKKEKRGMWKVPERHQEVFL